MPSIMKTAYAIGLVATAVVITVAIEESRISTLRQQLAAAQITETSVTPKTLVAAPSVSAEAPAAPLRTKNRPDFSTATRTSRRSPIIKTTCRSASSSTASAPR